jgi:hypothetical protein
MYSFLFLDDWNGTTEPPPSTKQYLKPWFLAIHCPSTLPWGFFIISIIIGHEVA